MKIAGYRPRRSRTNRTDALFHPRRTGSNFRALVRDLSQPRSSGRVELRQLSPRDDEPGSPAGIGSCGRELCCSTFLVDFEPVSVRMAKRPGPAAEPVADLAGRAAS